MRKGTQITEEMVSWSAVSEAAQAAAQAAAKARSENFNPMSDQEIEQRARNAQDREDLRQYVNGGNLSGSCKSMTRSELVAEVNRQLVEGLYGKGSKAGFKAVRRMRESIDKADVKMPAKYAGECSRCSQPINIGDTMFWNRQFRLATCENCH